MSFVFRAIRARQVQTLIKCVERDAMTSIIYHCCLALSSISGKEAHARACSREPDCSL